MIYFVIIFYQHYFLYRLHLFQDLMGSYSSSYLIVNILQNKLLWFSVTMMIVSTYQRYEVNS